MNIILIERYNDSNLSSLFMKNLLKKKKTSSFVDQIINKYQGFEGELIAFFPISKPGHDLDNEIQDALKIKKKHYIMFGITAENENLSILATRNFVRMGYEVGICEEESTVYSSIFNEILFGSIDELIFYKEYLNENFLFPNKFLAEKYIFLHNQLSSQGKDVEDYEPMKIYEIWKYVD